MNRWWILGGVALVLVAAPVGFVTWVLSDLSDVLPEIPFSSAYGLPSGENVTVSGTATTDFQGDDSASYKVVLRFRDGKQEVVADETVINEETPGGPFILLRTATHLLLSGTTQTYIRPVHQGKWELWSYQDASLSLLGRALMPSRYAHRKKFHGNCHTQYNNDCLPEIPFYKFERWNAASPLIVMRQNVTSTSNKIWASLWPKRLVFDAGNLDVARTLALEPRLKLRPLPQGVRVECVKMRLPADLRWFKKVRMNHSDDLNYSKARQVNGARLLSRDVWSLSSRAHSIPFKARTTLKLRGLCSDPDPQILHINWSVAGNKEQWSLVHNGQWLYIQTPQSPFQNPHLFARFSWTPRQNHRARK